MAVRLSTSATPPWTGWGDAVVLRDFEVDARAARRWWAPRSCLRAPARQRSAHAECTRVAVTAHELLTASPPPRGGAGQARAAGPAAAHVWALRRTPLHSIEHVAIEQPRASSCLVPRGVYRVHLTCATCWSEPLVLEGLCSPYEFRDTVQRLQSGVRLLVGAVRFHALSTHQCACRYVLRQGARGVQSL